jgi:hypothetical protein
MNWIGKRVELRNKKTGERKLGTIVEDGPTQTVFLSDDGEKLLAWDWYYWPVEATAPDAQLPEVQK